MPMHALAATPVRTPASRAQPLKVCPSCSHVLSPHATEAEAAAYVRRGVKTLRNLRVSGGGPRFCQLVPGGGAAPVT